MNTNGDETDVIQVYSTTKAQTYGNKPVAAAETSGPMAESVDKEEWQVGDVILGRYEVLGELGEGGMGKVLKVHDRSWNMALAVKNPKARSFKTDNLFQLPCQLIRISRRSSAAPTHLCVFV